MTLVSENTFHSPDLVSLCTVILYVHIHVYTYVCLFIYAEALYHEAFSAIPVIKWALVSNQLGGLRGGYSMYVHARPLSVARLMPPPLP